MTLPHWIEVTLGGWGCAWALGSAVGRLISRRPRLRSELAYELANVLFSAGGCGAVLGLVFSGGVR